MADDCSFVCDDGDAISGSSTLCTSGIYSVSNAATSVDWILVPANARTINELNTAATIIETTIANGYSGFVTLNAMIDSDRCGNNIPVNKTIHFGRPSTSGSVLTGNGGGSLDPGSTDAIVFSVSTQNINAWTHIN
ncbi:hypothetical protein ES692_07675 [Psychroserpens burtonensis]|uniref:Uncharacterized protein n=1 Tax=Psychroserpens burtonensis TaxID=49278 RepID=A0A5C7BB00_9FLAO|nr:hypothetical protein [Psychroserpens burtonensis]TXE18113.1 hypothetical protein ES692_07675 [Psychroserpens burtonensis]